MQSKKIEHERLTKKILRNSCDECWIWTANLAWFAFWKLFPWSFQVFSLLSHMRIIKRVFLIGVFARISPGINCISALSSISNKSDRRQSTRPRQYAICLCRVIIVEHALLEPFLGTVQKVVLATAISLYMYAF